MFSVLDGGSNTCSTALDASTLTIIKPMRLPQNRTRQYNVVISKEMPAAYGMLGNKAGS